MKFDKFVASRYLRAKRKQAFIGVISIITLLGVTLGVTALNIALAIHNGMRKAFVESLVGETGQLYIVSNDPESQGFDGDDLAKITAALDQTPGVRAISLMQMENGVILSKRKQMAYAKLYGIDPKIHVQATRSLNNMEQGSASLLESRGAGQLPGIILGHDLADRLGVRRGDTVRTAVPRLSAPGLTRSNFKLREFKCEVVGVFRTGNSQFDQTDAYLLLGDMLGILNTTRIQTILVSFGGIPAMERGKTLLTSHSELPYFARVADLRDLNQGLFRALKLEKAATTLVIVLFILIVALNMISALTMLVMEKHRDIGIMKSFGVPSKTILYIFIRQGMTLAVLGALLGTVLGVGLSVLADRTRLIKLDNDVYEVLNYLPFHVDPMETIGVALGALALCLITCIYPARQAASLDPVEALKYD